ncbi:hypothetical protein BCR24_15050 [Enterococcus ureilyticus]|uniref:Gram-positive cocci surface proteins LPxTG domain-containing protein n=1 Tax=Enterococcus ureilyticus TaxID=1131292 RepID=A0A1E5HCH9_9ENTE|nr:MULTISPECIES: hypothetical protein [Enterococcus]MBM7690431.1 hypothetical protein [Enterococcus ureilyticus]MBO0473623.1 hypothetical protein [Enterococcus ureasiticus]OEG22525.1 hypothetical protein BCR24_15050 [Enterococcus ureilyticus]
MKKINIIYFTFIMLSFLLFSSNAVLAEQVETSTMKSTQQAKSEVGIHFTEKEPGSTTPSSTENTESTIKGGGDNNSGYIKPVGRTDLPKAGESATEIPMYIGMFMVNVIIVYIIYVNYKKYRKKEKK